MRIALITEGASEFKALPQLFPQLQQKMPRRSRIVRILRANITPDAPHPQVISSCRPALKIASNIADMAIVLLDREQQQNCPGDIAAKLEERFKKAACIDIRVVLKDRKFENWLISDLVGLKSHPARFNYDNALSRRVHPDKADRIDAERELKRISGGKYDKIPDGNRLCKTASVDRIAHNSRSFRHFLHLLNYEPYRTDCRTPAAATPNGSPKRRRTKP
ncbi:DUF4276 family protein [Mycobacterium sp. SMC-19]|uniref:DUF4276 family protein n=1 Tax=Mycobacterium sp. SMC-19 TaxID=3381630 RepID=UPI0038776FCE